MTQNVLIIGGLGYIGSVLYNIIEQEEWNVEILDIRSEENLILLKGAIPGAKSGIVEIKKIKFKK